MTKRIEIILCEPFRTNAANDLVSRGILSEHDAQQFTGPVFDVSCPKPGQPMTHHTVALRTTGGNFRVIITYHDGRGSTLDKVDYFYPAHTVARVEVQS